MGGQLRFGDTSSGAHSSQSQRARAKGGARAEDFVEELNKLCWTARVACLFRVPNDVKITRRRQDGSIEGFLQAQSAMDYGGWMLDGSGRAVAFDVKHIAEGEALVGGGEPAWRLPFSLLKPHQAEFLASCHAAGGVSLVMVVRTARFQRTAYAVPWFEVARAMSEGAKSLKQAEIEPHRCAPGRPFLAPFQASRWPRPGGAGPFPFPSAPSSQPSPEIRR